MKLLLISFTIFYAVSFTLAAQADPKEFLYWKWKQQQTIKSESTTAVTGMIQQKLDHANASDPRTFSQRYWYDNAYALNSEAPVLLYICGEAECSGSYLQSIANHAKKLGARLATLEHRYYGKSQPFDNLETKNLKYLSTRQALEDLVTFKKYASENLGFTGKWIAVGGSYAGILAAYIRSQYPNEFVGALSSSGPVMAENNFEEYDRHVAKMAGPECLAAVKSVVAEVENMVTTAEGFENAKKIFTAEPLREVDDFLYLVADTAAAAVQYGMREQFCNYVQSEGLIGYGKAATMVAQLFGNLVGLSVQAAEDTSYDPGGIGMRQWLYQSCTEYGFWQNAYSNSAESARSARINAAYHTNACKRLFGFTQLGNVDITNRTFYKPLLNPVSSNIFYTNGSEDPWMNLSITEKLFPQMETMVIEGAAHCDDLGSDGGNSQVALARKLFVDYARRWLK